MLDDVKRMASVDSRDMLGAVESMSEHLAEGVRRGRKAGPPKCSPDSVVVCGMGGSAIGGDVLRAWLATDVDIRCEVARGYSVPRHVGRQSLVVVSSYSGNTEESLSMLEDARARTSRIVTVSSGGRLAEMAASLSLPHVAVPSGMVPRASFGYMFGALLGVVERAGIASPGKQLDEAARVLAQVNGRCSRGVQTQDNPAKRMAHELHGSVPVVIGHGLSAPVARRWANQMNENAKSAAFASELPEMDHNEVVFWAADPRSQGFSAVFLDHDFSDARMARRLEATREMVCSRSAAHVVRATGRSPLAQIMSLVSVGDYISVYSAVLRGEDPSTTEPIERLKDIISKK
ncbi:MAG: bifunctional phosphoglucose/phosphomannose isomerase [Candidatus Thermoplasmatota archaeon]